MTSSPTAFGSESVKACKQNAKLNIDPENDQITLKSLIINKLIEQKRVKLTVKQKNR